MNNTGNAVPSTSPLDLQDNAVTLDQLINGDSIEVTSRTGKVLKGIAALQAIITSLDLGSFTFADTSSGLTGTTNGQYFRIPDEESSGFIYYSNNNGQAIEVAHLVGQNYIDYRVTPETYSQELIPLFVDQVGNVPLWLEGGKIEGVGLGDTLNPIDKRWGGSNVTPLFIDEKGYIPLWLEEGRVNGFLSSGLLSQIDERKDISSGKTLWRFKAKCSQLKAGSSAKLKIGFAGDSWAEHSTISQVFLNYFSSKYGKASTGWIQFGFDTGGTPDYDGVKVTKTGWTQYDMGPGASEVTTAPYPTAMDGMLIYTPNATATFTVSNLYASSLRLFYVDLDGAFNIIVNGGSPVKVSGKGTGGLLSYQITGLDITSTSNITINTSDNSGTVAFAGMYAEGKLSGVEVNKMGNGYSTAFNYTAIDGYIPTTASIIDLDLLFIILGTNDANLDQSVSKFKNGIEALILAWQKSSPTTGIVLVSPPYPSGNPKYPREYLVSAGKTLASKLGIEFFNMHSYMPGYDTTNSYGLWRNSAHLSDSGAYFMLNELNRTLLGE